MPTKKILEDCKKINSEFHYFNEIADENYVNHSLNNNKKDGKLARVYISIKDCVVVKDMESKAGSKILTGYKPVFDATVVDKIKKESGIIIGKTSQDEFGFGSFSRNVGVGFPVPLNPFDKERVCGGSSGGSAGITQRADFRHIAIAESTGGSIVCPAAFCGVYGLCPTYGLVSRYGLMDYANSLDKIGPMAKNISDIALAMDVIAGYDELDSTSVKRDKENYSECLIKNVSGIRIGIIKEAFGDGTDKEVSEKVMEYVDNLRAIGATVKEVSLPLNAKYSLATYYIIAMSEASTNLSKYCGMRYGKHEELVGGFNEYFSKVRSANFGDEAKRRIMLGTFARMSGFRDAYYIKALKVRTKLIEEYKNAFAKFDVLISPTMPVVAPKFSDIEKLTPLQNYMMDVLTVGPNLAGLPHISIPIGSDSKHHMPIGLMAIANHFDEGKLIMLGKALEDVE